MKGNAANAPTTSAAPKLKTSWAWRNSESGTGHRVHPQQVEQKKKGRKQVLDTAYLKVIIEAGFTAVHLIKVSWGPVRAIRNELREYLSS